MRRRLLLLLTTPLLACELTEVTVPVGESRVVVQSVLSVGASRQIVVVERSLTGTPRGSSEPAIPPNEPPLPVRGAIVILTHDGPSACASPVDTLRASNPESGVYATDTTAIGAASFCALEPGDRVRLRVEAPDGTVVTGTTLIPGARQVSVRLSADSATAVGDTLELDRQRDTLRIGVDAILARAMQVEARWRDSVPNLPLAIDPYHIAFYLFIDTLGIALPANLSNPFEGDNGEPVFEVGRTYTLTVAVTDSNYFDFARSASDPITGRGFINHLEGGIGVFGSVAPYRYTLRVVR